MRVLFSSTPGEGHVRPLLPLARALRARAHEIAFATHAGWAPRLEEAGFPVLAAGLHHAEARRFLPLEELRTFNQKGSRLQGHPDMLKLPGIDISTGSLGMGLSAGLGMALAARHLGLGFRTWVLLGDGECQEGQVWEAAHVAPRYGLDNLVGIVDHNQFQQFGWRGSSATDRLPPAPPGALAARFAAFGWRVSLR